jgi:hypothetical protein
MTLTALGAHVALPPLFRFLKEMRSLRQSNGDPALLKPRADSGRHLFVAD